MKWIFVYQMVSDKNFKLCAHYYFRWADNSVAVGIDDGPPRKFDHPFLQVIHILTKKVVLTLQHVHNHVSLKYEFLHIYRPPMKLGKIMFSIISVSLLFTGDDPNVTTNHEAIGQLQITWDSFPRHVQNCSVWTPHQTPTPTHPHGDPSPSPPLTNSDLFTWDPCSLP